MHINLPSPVLKAINLLNNSNYEAFIVGGSIRNHLLNLEVFDYDLTTSATPQEMKEVFSEYKIIETGIKHGTLTIYIDHMPLEITTYRIEKEYLNHRHPLNVSFSTSLHDDLVRRDFTINALAYHPKLGMKDFFNGVDDLDNKIIRAINNPYQRFDEDALRIMRALRFAACLNFEIEEQTKQALHESAHLLSHISKERINNELTRLITGENASAILLEFKDIFELIIPNLNIRKMAEKVELINKCPSNINMRMAILLLDSDNPKESLKELKFANKDQKDILTLIEYANIEIINDKKAIKQLLSKLNQQTLIDILDFKSYLENKDYEAIKFIINEIITNNECLSIKQLAINGNDLKVLKLDSSSFSIILNDVLEKVINEEINNSKDEIIKYVLEKY